METVLIVDDDSDAQFLLSNILRHAGYRVAVASDGAEAITQFKMNAPDMVLLDIRLPGMDGMKVLEKMKGIDREAAVIMLTAYGDIRDAVRAMKLGAFDYITKPFDDEELTLIIKRAFEKRDLSREVKRLRKKLGEQALSEEVLGESPEMKEVIEQVRIVAPTNMTVVVEGESGAGKELISRMIHQESRRKDGPFVAIDCGALPETLVESELFGYEKGAFTGAEAQKKGRFEQAEGGTLLLDEISNLPEAAQAKLLRVLEESEVRHLGGEQNIAVDVRVIVATNTDLSEAVKTGDFREDLFYRINQFHIRIPPLRQRREDIPALAGYFLKEAARELDKKLRGFSAAAMRFLLDYDWPGNVRELKNVVRRAALLTGSLYVNPEYLSSSIVPSEEMRGFTAASAEEGSLREVTERVTKRLEADLIKRTLEKTNGNKAKAARILKVDYKTLWRKLKEYGI